LENASENLEKAKQEGMRLSTENGKLESNVNLFIRS
jgi:hypothetical protein